MTAHEERMVRVVAEALRPVVPNPGGAIWHYQHEDGSYEPVTLTTAAEAVVAALEAAGLVTDWQEDEG